MTRLALAIPSVALLVAVAAPAGAQPVLNQALITNQTVTGTLDATVRSLVEGTLEAAWIGWQAPSVPRRSRGDNWCWSEGSMVRSNRLEPSDTLFVFLRVENRRTERVRLFDDGCPIDAGGRPVTWLRDVQPAQSVALLARLAESRDGPVSKGALAALAQHAGPDAVTPLLRLARQAPDAKTRGDALFWLSQRAGQEAAAAITDAIANDPDTAVKKKAVFALSQLPADEGVPKLIDVARTHSNPAVRKQAMFWLGQSKDERAIKFFEEILR